VPINAETVVIKAPQHTLIILHSTVMKDTHGAKFGLCRCTMCE
jgi:hypothetical protein